MLPDVPPLTGGCRQDYIRSVIAGSIPAAGNGVNPANLAAHLFRSMAANALETTSVAGSSPAPLSAGSSVG